MLLACLILVSAGITIHFVTWIVSVRAVTREYHEVVTRFNDFFSQSAPDQPSDFHKIIDQSADLIAERTRIGVMAADRGAQGAAVRDATRALEGVAAEEDPALLVASALPKNLRKNPLAAAGLQMLIQRLMTGSGPGKGPGSAGNGSNQIKFDL